MDHGTQLLEAALQLPPSERAQLIEGILSSFEPETRQRIDRLWAQEAEDRIDAYDRGELGSVPAESVFAEVLRDRGQWPLRPQNSQCPLLSLPALRGRIPGVRSR